jgi:hypothetical protein
MRAPILAVAILLAPAAASAQSTIRQTGVHERPADFSLLLGLPFPFGFGAGMRVGIPVAHDGFIGSVNDAVFVEPGFQFAVWAGFDDSIVGVQVPVLMRWDFFLTREWTVFGSVGPVFGFYFTDRGGRRGGNFELRGSGFVHPGGAPGFFGVSVGGGAFYNFSRDAALRLDASTGMLAVGLVWRF